MSTASVSHPTLREELRAATAAKHAALDEALAGTLADREGYVAFLRASHAAIALVEPALGAFAIAPDADRARRIEADLERLGAPAPPEPSSWKWKPESLAEAQGCAYVIEGSALGGVMLAKTVEATLGAQVTSYLRLRGAETAAAWRAFVARLDAWGEAASPTDRRKAIEAANQTFAIYWDAFKKEGVIGEPGA